MFDSSGVMGEGADTPFERGITDTKVGRGRGDLGEPFC